MAPPNLAQRHDKERRGNTLLSFSANARAKLSPMPSGPISFSLSNQFQEHISTFPANLSLASLKCQDLDTEGLTLWNLCTRLMRGKNFPSTPDQRDILVAARVFAFLLLDAGQTKDSGTLGNVVRLMKVALKAAKSCIDAKRFDFSLKVLEKAAGYEEQLNKPKGTVKVTPEEADVHSRLQSEYFVVRTALAWRQDQLEVAEHMYTKAALSEKNLDPDTAENLSDLLFEIGKDLYKKKQYEMASKWLERASNVLTAQELEKLSTDATNLRTSIIQSRIQALLAIERDDALDLANSLVDSLENEIGDKLIVLLLKLELLSAHANKSFDCDAYGAVVHRMIRTVVLTESNFKLIMHHIRKLNDKGPSLACSMLDAFLRSRLFQEENEGWVEAALINRIWMSTSQKDGLDVLRSVTHVIDTLGSNMDKPLSASATHAAQTLLWKRIESNYAQGQYETAESWCRLAMHKVFGHTGDLNKAKIARKLLMCALARGDILDARGILEQIPETAKDDPMTRFLMFKIAVRNDELDLASMCLERVYEAASKDATLLYACVLDAQQVGHKALTIAALQMVLQKYEYNAPPSIHLPSLLRCMIRLVLSQMESAESRKDIDVPSAIEQLCRLVDGASTQAQRSSKQGDKTNTVWTMQELDWFSKNAYNLSLKYSSEWPPRQVLRIIQSCIKFMGMYPKDVSQLVARDTTHRHIFSDFLAVILLVALARAEDNVEVQLQDYLRLRQHVDNFDTQLQSMLEDLEDGPLQDLLSKLATLLIYDFEAAIRLRKWEELTEVILKADCCKSMKVYEQMSDMLLSDPSIPVKILIPTLKRIINEAWALETFDTAKLSRYMRCLFRLALSSAADAALAESLLEQIAELARAAQDSDAPYPPEEIEYVATTAFNRAVDLYCLGEDAACRRWAERAVTVAGYGGDGGVLGELLQERLVGLQWAAEEG